MPLETLTLMVDWLQSDYVAWISASVLYGEIYKTVRALPDITHSTKTLNEVLHAGHYITIEADADKDLTR